MLKAWNLLYFYGKVCFLSLHKKTVALCYGFFVDFLELLQIERLELVELQVTDLGGLGKLFLEGFPLEGIQLLEHCAVGAVQYRCRDGFFTLTCSGRDGGDDLFRAFVLEKHNTRGCDTPDVLAVECVDLYQTAVFLGVEMLRAHVRYVAGDEVFAGEVEDGHTVCGLACVVDCAIAVDTKERAVCLVAYGSSGQSVDVAGAVRAGTVDDIVVSRDRRVVLREDDLFVRFSFCFDAEEDFSFCLAFCSVGDEIVGEWLFFRFETTAGCYECEHTNEKK